MESYALSIPVVLTVQISRADDGGVRVKCLLVPDLIVEGETRELALAAFAEAAEHWMMKKLFQERKEQLKGRLQDLWKDPEGPHGGGPPDSLEYMISIE